MRIIDAHLHLWDPALGIYSWLTPRRGLLYDRFTPEEARTELDAAGIDGAVLVQAADHCKDTEMLVAVAEEHSWVLGVVGWVDLEDPNGAADALDRLGAHPAFCGVRQLVHDDPRENVYGLPAVRSTARLLADHGLPIDIPDAFPRDLGAATALARDVEGLTVVLDHLGKPPRGSDAWAEWRRQLKTYAQAAGAVAKVSGLASPTAPWDADSLRPTLEHALECFGADRLMFGSDWPVTVAGSGYSGTYAVLDALLKELSPSEQAAIRGDTATRVYGLGCVEEGRS